MIWFKLFTTAEITFFASMFDGEYVAMRCFTESSRCSRKNGESASGPLVSLPTKAVWAVICPADSEIALLSIWSHPSSVLPSKKEIVLDSLFALPILARGHPAIIVPANLTNDLRLKWFISLRISPSKSWLDYSQLNIFDKTLLNKFQQPIVRPLPYLFIEDLDFDRAVVFGSINRLS